MTLNLHEPTARRVLRRLATALTSTWVLLASACIAAEGPAQPPVGCVKANPSMGAYPHQLVCHQPLGTGGMQVWIFTPDAPRPAVANVVLFLHGYRATDPVDYAGWIDHLAREGNIVLYPVFEAARGDPPEVSERNEIEATKQALRWLATNSPIKPSLAGFSVVGHSFGGGLSARFAALAGAAGLPQPKAVMAVEPGWQGGSKYPADNLTQIPPSTYLIIVGGDRDQFEDSRQSGLIYRATPQIPPDHKTFVRFHSTGNLIADHYMPLSPIPAYHLEQKTGREERRASIVKGIMHIRDGEIDALDTQGLWPMFDKLIALGERGGSVEGAVRAASVPVTVGK